MKKILPLFFLLLFCNSLFSQEDKPLKRKDVLKEYGLKRNSVEYYAIGGFAHYPYNGKVPFNVTIQTREYYWGSAIRFSSNWYFNIEKKNRWYFRTNWIMGGFAFQDGLIFPSAPLNIGFGDNIQLSENISLDLAISGGLVLIGPGFMSEEVRPIGAIYPEIKLQTKWISIGLIYSRVVDRSFTYNQPIYHTLMLGLSAGF